MKLRFVMYVLFPVKLLVKTILAPKNSLFLITSNTFFAPLVVALVGKLKRFRTVQLVYDLFPDAMEASGAIQPGGLMAAILGVATRYSQRLCDACVFLGETLRSHAEKRWGTCRISRAIHIGANTGLFDPVHEERLPQTVTIHYGGQLGYMHDASTLAKCLRHAFRHSDECTHRIRFSFLISGAHAAMLKETLAAFPIDIGDALPSREWRKRIRHFQIGLVTLSPGGAIVCLPSKTYAMMAGGLAILAICPLWSDLAKLVLENDIGWVVNNSQFTSFAQLSEDNYICDIRHPRDERDVMEEFRQVLRTIVTRPDILQEKRMNAQRVARDAYGQRALSKDWAELFAAVRSLR